MLQTTTREIAQSWFTTSPEATEPRAIAIIAAEDDTPPLPAHVLELISDKLEAPVQLYFSSVRHLRTFQASKADSAQIALVIADTPLTGALSKLPTLCATDVTAGIPMQTLLRQIDMLSHPEEPQRAA